MAKYQLDISQPLTPSSASPESSMRAEAARGAVGAGIVGAAAQGYEMKKEYDIKKGAEEARGLLGEFLSSNMQAETAAQDVAVNEARVNDLMKKNRDLSTFVAQDHIYGQGEISGAVGEQKANLAAIEGFRSETKRLKAAAEAGMTNQEYALRVAAITKSTIAKYPGLGDQIRQEMGRITGLAGADDFAAYAFVKSRFDPTPTDKNKGLPKPEDIIKDVATKGGFTIKETYDAYQKDPKKFAEMERYASSAAQIDVQKKAIENNLGAESLASNADARSKIPMLQAYAGMHGMQAYSELSKEMSQEQIQQLLKKTDGDPAEMESVLKQYGEQLKWKLGQKKRETYAIITNQHANSNGRVSSDTIAEMKKAVDEEYKFIEEQYANPKGQLAALGVLVQHRDKTLDQQVKILASNNAFVQAWANNTVFQAWLAGGKSRENVAKQYPEFSKMMDGYEANAISGNRSIQANMRNGAIVSAVTAGARDAERTFAATPGDNKEAIVGAEIQAMHWLDSWKKNKTIPEESAKAVSTLLSNGAGKAASYQTIARNYNDLQTMVNEVPVEYKGEIIKAVEPEYARAMQFQKRQWDDNNKGKVKLAVVPGTTTVGVEVEAPGAAQKMSGTVGPVTKRAKQGVTIAPDSYYDSRMHVYMLAQARVRSIVTGESLDKSYASQVDYLNSEGQGIGLGGSSEKPITNKAQPTNKAEAAMAEAATITYNPIGDTQRLIDLMKTQRSSMTPAQQAEFDALSKKLEQ